MKIVITVALFTLLVGCNSTKNASTTLPQDANTSKTVINSLSSKPAFNVLSDIPYGNKVHISENIKNECHLLGQQFSNSILRYAPKHKVNVVQVENLPANGTYVELAIVNIFSSGNAFIGHRKSATVEANMFVKGKKVATTTKTRNSSGGAFGGFKGSCAVLKHTMNTLGSDIGRWIAKQQN